MTPFQSLLLASASPRRRQLLALLELPYTMAVSPVDEDALTDIYTGPNEGLGQWLAEEKARGALALPEASGRLVVTADTTVLLNGTLLGKPRDADHARELLRSLRGKWHHVITGVAVAAMINGDPLIRSERRVTPVRMRPYSDEEIDAYIASGDPLDKAGAYGIQHPGFQPTERIDGCYLNVVGLPLCALVDLLGEFGVRPAGERGDDARSWCAWSDRCLPLDEVRHD